MWLLGQVSISDTSRKSSATNLWPIMIIERVCVYTLLNHCFVQTSTSQSRSKEVTAMNYSTVFDRSWKSTNTPFTVNTPLSTLGDHTFHLPSFAHHCLHEWPTREHYPQDPRFQCFLREGAWAEWIASWSCSIQGNIERGEDAKHTFRNICSVRSYPSLFLIAHVILSTLSLSSPRAAVSWCRCRNTLVRTLFKCPLLSCQKILKLR